MCPSDPIKDITVLAFWLFMAVLAIRHWFSINVPKWERRDVQVRKATEAAYPSSAHDDKWETSSKRYDMRERGALQLIKDLEAGSLKQSEVEALVTEYFRES